MPAQRLMSLLFILVAVAMFIACEEETDDNQVGLMVGTWQLTDLKVDWVRDIASPAGTDPDTMYTLSASWDEAENILGSNAFKADRILANFAVGDTILDTTVAFNAAALVYLQIAMTATFNEDLSYTVTGTYPTLRLVADSCKTELVIPQISDAGMYEVDYLTGRFGISPGPFAQVLPEFSDGTFAFSNEGKTLTISYTDRDGHDQRITETGQEWEESENRVIHGAAELPVHIVTRAFSAAGDLRRSAYIMDTGGQLSSWGNYLTFYGLTVLGYVDELIATGAAASYAEAMALINQQALAGENEPATNLPLATLLTNDSGHDFDPADIGSGGKLTYVLNPVCAPVNEIIDFQTTWFRLD